MRLVRHRLLPAAVAGLLLVNGVGAGVGLVVQDDREADRTPPAAADVPAAATVAGVRSSPAFDPASVPAATRFLDRYVDPDGRVVRRDQGGDTVSEGQAYAMLVAVGVGDRARFDLVWGWTQAHLQRSDELLSWRWAEGAVVDEQPASDADLDAAWALTVADRRWPDGGYGEPGRALATAVAAEETYAVDREPVLAAGPWAVEDAEDDEPLVVNPSYASPVAADVLAASGGMDGPRSQVFGPGDRELVTALVDAHGAPPDWAVVRPDGAVAPSGPGGASGGSGFGWDAVRVPLRYAPGCSPDDQAVAASIWPAMEAGAGVDQLGDHPARLVGAAAAAAAAGDPARARALLGEAVERDEEAPSYYGAALAALGQLLLTTDRLGGCPPLVGP